MNVLQFVNLIKYIKYNTINFTTKIIFKLNLDYNFTINTVSIKTGQIIIVNLLGLTQE